MEKTLKTYLILAIICTLIFISWGTIRIVKGITFNLNCGAYLKRAAEANTVEIAKGELAKALNYIEKENLTTGIVSIFLKNPTNDIGFWYNNLKAAHEELDNLSDETTPLEKTNVLMKLRESLTDASDGSTSVTIPEGISIYPQNMIYFIWGGLSLIGTCLFWTIVLIKAEIPLEVKSIELTAKKAKTKA